jgi:pimeloyl-ACP methyl ester carboxylesterase
MMLATAGTVNAQSRGNYASVNGLKIYYEIHGDAQAKGPPLVLLHGGVGGIEMFGPNLPALAKTRPIIAVDLQGHGHTGDIDRPLRFESMADDIAALLKNLAIDKADVMGYSLGGGVALQTAIRHPSAVRKLVVVSAAFKRSAFYPEVRAAFDQIGPAAAANMKQSPLYKLYPNVDWPKLFGKIGDLLRQDYDWSNEVPKISAPTMIVFADADAFQPAHIVEFFRLLGGGRRDAGLDGSGRPINRLAVIPGATHYDILSTATVAGIVEPFLDAPTTASR